MELTKEQQQKVEDNLALVNYLLRKYNWMGENRDDYFQIGAYGLCKAVKKFDESKGTEFSTYASLYITGYIKRFYRECCKGPIRPTRVLRSSEQKIPDYIYIDGFIKETTGDCYGYDFIDAGINEEDEIVMNLTLERISNKLSESEKSTLNLALKGATQIEIAAKLHISQAQVSRIKKKLKQKLTAAFKG